MPSVFRHTGIRIGLATVKLSFFFHVTQSLLFEVTPASGPSMLPDFSTYGDWIAIDKRYRRGRGIGVGDLVIYKIPINKYEEGVKRVIGMPGDYVSINTPGKPGQEVMIQVPQGHCWITGDNLPASRDSRDFGPIPLALIQGKVVAKVLPWQERAWITNGLKQVNE